MRAKHLVNAIRLVEMSYNPKPYGGSRHVKWINKLKLKWDTGISSRLKTDELGWVYFILVDDELVKIGQTSAKNGIKGCLSFYESAGTDDCRDNRWTINYLMREAMELGKKVEWYAQYSPKVSVPVMSLTGTKTMQVPVSAKEMERACIEEYVSNVGDYPKWNFQESGKRAPKHILREFNEYTAKRLKEKS